MTRRTAEEVASDLRLGQDVLKQRLWEARLNDDEAVIAEILGGRTMSCSYSGKTVPGDHHGKYGHLTQLLPSNPNAAFFSFRPERAEDEYYCGCWGWD